MAHAIEVGACNAYWGHYKTLKSAERMNVFLIYKDEVKHRKQVYAMLAEFDAGPNPVLDATFWLIGTSVSLACRFMSRELAMWGAKMMEKLGAVCYIKLARIAREAEREDMSDQLLEMYVAEKRHELYFLGALR